MAPLHYLPRTVTVSDVHETVIRLLLGKHVAIECETFIVEAVGARGTDTIVLYAKPDDTAQLAYQMDSLRFLGFMVTVVI